MNIKHLAKRYFENIFLDNKFIVISELEVMDEIQNILLEFKTLNEKQLFKLEFRHLLNENFIKKIEHQKLKYGIPLLSNYDVIWNIYKWLNTNINNGVEKKKANINNLEDLVPNIENRKHLTDWLILNEYCNDSLEWICKEQGKVGILGYLLAYSLIEKNYYSNSLFNYETIIRVALNTFQLNISTRTIREVKDRNDYKKRFISLTKPAKPA